MARLYHSLSDSFIPACLILLLCLFVPTSLANHAALLRDVIHAYADNPGDTLILHVRVAPGASFDPETFSRHKNIAFDAVDVSKIEHEINSEATPKYHGLTLCVANLNQLSPSQCKGWSSHWSQPMWDTASNRSCQRGICSIVLLVSSGLVQEPECSALPRVHLKKVSSANGGCKLQAVGSSSCIFPVFDLTTGASIAAADVVDPRLELILNDQLDLHARILGTGSKQDSVRSFPTEFSHLKNFFVGQEHIMSELKDILTLRKFDEGGGNSKVLVLCFAGLSGTGKTMLGELIASVIHGKGADDLRAEGKFFEQSMGTWQNPEDSDALFGVKQGIVGDAKLFELIEKTPNLVVLLDEFSRAHEANRNAFFSAFESHVADKKTGKQVKTDRVTFILTTNTGQRSLLESSGVLEDPPRWNYRHNRSLPEVESVIQSGLQEFRREDPMFTDMAFRSRIREFFLFLPYSFEMRLEILNMTIAREARIWGSCFLVNNGCYCYGCKRVGDDCKCEDGWKSKSSSKVVFSHRAKVELLTRLSRKATMGKEYPNTRVLKDEVNKQKMIMQDMMIHCDLLEGDGFIVDYERHIWRGKVVPLAVDRQAKRAACLSQRSQPTHPPPHSDNSRSSHVPSPPAAASPVPSAKNGAAHQQVQRDVQLEDDRERDMNMRVAKAVADRSAEYDRRLKAVEDAARAREHAQAIIHAQEKQELHEKLANMQKELDLWKMRFTIVASALAIAVAAIVFLLFKILASPIVLSVMVLLLVVGLVLLRRYFPEIFAAMFKFFLWMLQNPFWGLLFLAFVVAVFYFRKRLFKKVFGETKMDKLQAENAKLLEDIKSLKALIAAKNDAKLLEEIKSLKTNVLTQEKELLAAKRELTKLTVEIEGHRTPEVNAPPSNVPATSGGAAVEQKMFSESPPSRQGLTLPAHTPIHDISSP